MLEVINEILTGRRIIYPEVDFASFVLCRGLTGIEKVISGIHFKNALKRACSLGLPTEDELRFILNQNGDWTDAHEKLLKSVDERISDLNSSLPGLTYRVSQKNATLKKVKKLKEQKEELVSKRCNLLNNSAESYALEYRYFWNIHKMIYKLDGSPVWDTFKDFEETDRDDVAAIISCYIRNFLLSGEEVRKIARSGMWRIYFTSCKNSKDLFDKPLCDLDDNQLNLLYWSNVYDNAFNAYEPPSEDTINNDELFDSWLDSYSEKIKKDRAQSKIPEVKGSKKGGVQQVFVPTDDEGAEQLYKEFGEPRIGL